MNFQMLKEKNLPNIQRQEEKKKIEQEDQNDQLTKLQEQSMKARMEYENTILKESLETSKKQYDGLNKESKEILYETLQDIMKNYDLIKNQVKELKTSNQTVNETVTQQFEKLNQEYLQKIGNLNYNTQNMLKKFESKIETIYTANTARINKETADTVQKCEELQDNSKKRFKSYYNRKKIIDCLIYIDLAITPILLIVLCVILFKK